MQRTDGRVPDEIRPLNFELNAAPHASGSVLVSMGNTRVICAVTIEEGVPRWMKEQGVTGGWLTAEYSMLPYSTQPRKARDIAKGRMDGRSVEIQRLIGRSLRAVIDLEKLGPRTIWVDCDVLQADGGTRTTAITGASLALAIACRKLIKEKKLDAPPMQKLIAAVSPGVLDGQAVLDLDYEEDKLVSVDFNLVATEDSEFVEVQGSGEEATFTGSQLDEMLALGCKGISALIGRASTFNTSRIDHLYADPHVNGVRMFLHYGDLSDSVNLVKLLYELKPDEIYHLGAQSHVRVSFDIPEYTSDVTGVGTIRILEAIREAGLRSSFFQASSSEMFGKAQEVPQTEKTPFWPRSPYGVAKIFSYWATINYRESYGLCASNGIMFNHESPRRGETFVSRKISRAVAAIKHGLQKELFLGNLEAKRDWGYAPEYVAGMWQMLQQDSGDDFVFATNETHTVREFCEAAFARADLDWKQFVKHDPRYERPAEVDLLLGDASKAKKILRWEPKVRFHELVRIMVDADVDLLSRGTPRERLGRLP